MKFSKAKERPDGSKPSVDIAIPAFGYQNHVSIDRRFGLIRKWQATDAASYEGARLRERLLDKTNTASCVWADTAYRSKVNEAFMDANGFVSRVHRKKPKGGPMARRTAIAMDLPRFDSAPVSHLSGLSFEGQGTFPPQS